MPAFKDICQMLGSQVFGQPALPHGDFAGQTVIITGANTGVGFQAAKHIARMNADYVILACRNADKGANAMKFIRDEVNPRGKIEVWPLDLANYQSVMSFGERASSLLRLDCLIANAGLELQDFQTIESLEMQLCVNVVSTILCACAVLPRLRATSTTHEVQTNITFQGSAYHIFAPDQELDVPEDADIFEELSQQPIDVMGRYALSKLMMHQCAHELAKRVTDVVINISHPGWAGTELSRSKESTPLGQRIGFAMIGWSAEKGSRPCVYAVKAGQNTHGCYLSEGRITQESQFMRTARGQEAQKRVWRDLMSRLQSISPDIAKDVI